MTEKDLTVAYQIFDKFLGKYVSRDIIRNFLHGDFDNKIEKYVWKNVGGAKLAAITLYNSLMYTENIKKYGKDYYFRGNIRKFSEQDRLEVHKMRLTLEEVCK